MKLLKAKALPISAKSRTDRDDPSRELPMTDSVAPKRAKLLRASVAPKLKKSRSDTDDPNREKLRTDKEEPS
jgi:hypothetical protein